MSSKPKIAVVLPTFNRADTLGRAIDSVLQQDFRDLELIVVDDGSTDGTDQIVRKNGDERLRFLRGNESRGANWARNRGIQLARANVVCFLDSDDVYLPGKLSRIVERFSADPKMDVLVDSFVVRRGEGKDATEREKRNPVLDERCKFRDALFQRRIYKATPALSARRSALLDVGGFDETLARRQDFDLIARLARRHQCASTDEILWVKYVTKGSISDSSVTFLEASIAICDRHPEYIQEFQTALYSDLRHHFEKLIKRRKWATLALDIRRYRDYRPFEVPLHALLLRFRIPSKR